MQNQDLAIVGLWWRFTDYQIFEASKPQNLHPHFVDYYRYIRPAPGAELETFPVRLSSGKEGVEDEVFSPHYSCPLESVPIDYG